MGFDPSTAQPVNVGGGEFDPTTAKPVTDAGKYLKTSQMLGAYKGVTRPLDNAALGLSYLAHKVPLPFTHESVGDAVDQLGSAAGLPTAQQAVQGHKNYVASQQSAGIKPGGVGEFFGSMLGTAPTMLLPGGPVAMGAASGALTSDDLSLPGLLKSAGEGAVLGKLGDVATKAVANTIYPAVSGAAKKLLDEGVSLTPGQILGGTMKRLEDAATSIPFVGDTINNARNRGLQTFNRAMVNHVLKPIGETLPDDVPVGREAVEYAGQKVSDAYGSLLPKLTVQADQTFTGNVANLKQLAQNLQPSQAQQFSNVLKNEVLDKFTGVGAMSGDTLKDVETTLGKIVRRYSSHNATPADLDYRDAVAQLQQEVRDLVARQNPAAASTLGAINKSYAGLLRIENAAGRSGAENGVFTAPQFSAAVRALDSSARKRAFSRGNAMLQDFADTAKEVLPSKVPDSGTAKRVMTGGLLGAGAHILYPAADPTLLGAAGAIGGAHAMYSRPGIAALSALLTKRPQGAQTAAQLIRSLSGPAALGAAALGPQLQTQP